MDQRGRGRAGGGRWAAGQLQPAPLHHGHRSAVHLHALWRLLGGRGSQANRSGGGRRRIRGRGLRCRRRRGLLQRGRRRGRLLLLGRRRRRCCSGGRCRRHGRSHPVEECLIGASGCSGCSGGSRRGRRLLLLHHWGLQPGRVRGASAAAQSQHARRATQGGEGVQRLGSVLRCAGAHARPPAPQPPHAPAPQARSRRPAPAPAPRARRQRRSRLPRPWRP